MKIKTSELSGTALDYAVAKCRYLDEYDKDRIFLYHSGFKWAKHTVRIANQSTCSRDLSFEWCPSTDWSQCGMIIEQENISVYATYSDWWATSRNGPKLTHSGPTPLIAAMRCFVEATLGGEIDIPDSLAV